MEKKTGNLERPVQIGNKIAANRFFANPMELNNAADDGSPTDMVIKRYKTMAKGKWGCVCVENATAGTDLSHRGFGDCGLLLNEMTVTGFRALVAEFRSVDTDTILLQQISPGKHGMGDAYAALSADEIQRAQDDLINACILAAEAGFDGADLKQCHDTLGNRLIGAANERTDQWGGAALEERSRFIAVAVERIRAELSRRGKEDFLIGTRISENDLVYLSDMIRFFRDSLKLDFVNISSFPWENTFASDVVFLLSRVVMLMQPGMKVVCSAASDSIVQEAPLGKTHKLMSYPAAPDFIGFGRQTLADPLMPAKVLRGDDGSVKWCKKCGGCVNKLIQQERIECATYKGAPYADV